MSKAGIPFAISTSVLTEKAVIPNKPRLFTFAYKAVIPAFCLKEAVVKINRRLPTLPKLNNFILLLKKGKVNCYLNTFFKKNQPN